MKWLLAGTVALAMLGVLALALFGPNSTAILSPQTTYITTPLAADGLPNYALALLNDGREGMTPENNGAVLFWRAIGPHSMEGDLFVLLCNELQINPAPSPPYLVDVSGKAMTNRVSAWHAAEHSAAQVDGRATDVEDQTDAVLAESGEFDADSAAQDLIQQISDVAWTGADCPPLADWVAENEEPLDLLTAAAACPKFYSPPPNVLKDPQVAVVGMIVPHIQELRTAVRALSVRATFRIGNRRYADAWRDCWACWRFGSAAGSGALIVERLVGMSVRSMARESTLSLLQRDDLPLDLAQQILDDLNALTPRIAMADPLKGAERYMFLDYTLRAFGGRFGGTDEYDDISKGLKTFRAMSLDVNVPLRIGNRWYDRLTAAAEIDDRHSRNDALAKLDDELARLNRTTPSQFAGGAFSRHDRSSLAGEVMAAYFLPALSAAVQAEDRDAAGLTLARIAAALAVFRARTGVYPDSLAELAPSILVTIPVDPYANQPPIYKRRDNGYLLYSVYENGVDDGGDDFNGEIIAGEWASPEDQSGMPKQADYVHRVPHPPLRSPFRAATSATEPDAQGMP